ncbi:MAG: Lrp/AsnC family transcriptional regulator [Robiginitomaculum sp.]|nr:Lrp/AsnC family transcriptional regulator [Robiginitomaculum sp.]
MHDLDAKDKLLLAALKRNSRASIVSLARDIDLSRSATHDRMLRLEESGILQAYTIQINAPNLFNTLAIFMVRFKHGYDNILTAKKVSKFLGVTSTYCLSGDVDLLVHVECSDTQAMVDLRESISALSEVNAIRTYSVLAKSGA